MIANGARYAFYEYLAKRLIGWNFFYSKRL
jgi:hypothetical protein